MFHAYSVFELVCQANLSVGVGTRSTPTPTPTSIPSQTANPAATVEKAVKVLLI